ncbi:hypothetical protein ACTOB_000586 [Actinoplanes oblitus]|uniref:ATP-dependent DNA ligase family profile domain-containing protein n=1 Tax=Actinoplanes oblitus TaxID=3040509 RepID=A0ABY8WJP5_9ACTN|nr:hypothetical protein [Actinoplanes oblitus]WIM97092.1 hypothetical protein ACTOB_000586 [Actinoplanes oblitus]
MRLSWDETSNKIVTEDGAAIGELRNIEDYDIPSEAVADVSLREWKQLFREVLTKRGEVVSPAIWRRDKKFIFVDDLESGKVEVSIDAHGPQWDLDQVKRTIEALCLASNDELHEIVYQEEYWIFHLVCDPDDRTTEQLFALQGACADLLKLPDGPGLEALTHAESVHRMVLAGGGVAIVGLRESSWLEVKSRAYNSAVFADEIELAQDVARFANGSESALLLLGYRTSKRDGVDRITKICPLRIEESLCSRYQQLLDRRVYPPLEGLKIDYVAAGSGGLLAILIPRQPEAAKPYLVHGAIIDGKNEGSFISIIQRRDEGSRPMSPMEIHALLSAGRSALRGTFGS